MTGGAMRPRRIVGFVGPIYDALERMSYPLMRIVTGLFLIPHGAQKLFGLFGGDITNTAGFFAKVGIEPALPLAYATGGVEFFGGLLLVIGLLTRIAAAGVAIMMAVAILSVHLANGFFWTSGGYEYPLMWGLLMLAIFIRGGGDLSVDRAIGYEF
jgi:putative oxidoreductase